MCSGGQGGDRQRGGGVRHIGPAITLSASCSLAFLCFMFKAECILFQFMVWILREVTGHHIIILAVPFTKNRIEKKFETSLIHYIFLQT